MLVKTYFERLYTHMREELLLKRNFLPSVTLWRNIMAGRFNIFGKGKRC